MPPTLTARDRATLLGAVLTKVGEPELRAAIDRLDASGDAPRSVANAAKALRRGRGVVAALGRPPYRSVLPFLARAVAAECLARTVEALGDDSDDPSAEQLASALEEVRGSFDDATIAVMLASVGTDDMPASALCLELVTSDERYGLTEWQQGAADGGEDVTGPAPGAGRDSTGAGRDSTAPEPPRAAPERQAARRQRRQAAARDRRRRHETAQRAAEQVRTARKKERQLPVPPRPTEVGPSAAPRPRAVPTLVRRPVLTPSQRQEFDPDDPLVGALVYLWVPFDRDTADGDEELPGASGRTAADAPEEGEPPGERTPAEEVSPAGDGPPAGGKLRPCVVVGVGRDEVLVRPGYSEGGRKSRDWTSVPLQHWRKLGLEQPTWIGSETRRLPRPEVSAPPSRLVPSDWNALW